MELWEAKHILEQLAVLTKLLDLDEKAQNELRDFLFNNSRPFRDLVLDTLSQK